MKIVILLIIITLAFARRKSFAKRNPSDSLSDRKAFTSTFFRFNGYNKCLTLSPEGFKNVLEYGSGNLDSNNKI